MGNLKTTSDLYLGAVILDSFGTKYEIVAFEKKDDDFYFKANHNLGYIKAPFSYFVKHFKKCVV